MTYEELGRQVYQLLAHHEEEVTDVFNEVAFIINEYNKRQLPDLDANNTRSPAEIVNLLQTLQNVLPQGVQYTETALVLAAIQVLANFSLKLLDKVKEDK